MEHKQRAKMPASQRAKQFMPFAAVKGLEEAIAREEQDMKSRERPEFDEEKVDAVNAILCRLRKGMITSIRVYSWGKCLYVQGKVERIDLAVREMTVNGIRIGFDDILGISELTV